MKAGDKVTIVKDCRDEETATGQEGIYEGRFVYDASDCSFLNPRIRLADGSVIWGCECWWKPIDGVPLEQAQAALREYVKELVAG